MTATTTTSANVFTALKSRIEEKRAAVAIIGLGYVGLPLALLYSDQKFPVTGFDIDQRKVTTLDQGGSYIVRIPAADIKAAKAQGFS
ncbi:MAG TPA: NAD(P)-binding domain-containing protein, partial [Terriglobales bacterium]|nr:NAD(P)-binding domain-containing protein [Terriglobales bacterium]HTA25815.1 NAD(P)-binding domain-containing protein [Terriglobales bacterium]